MADDEKQPAHQLPDGLQRRQDRATVEKAEADARKAASDADASALKSQLDAVAAVVPDLSDIAKSNLSVAAPTGPAVGGTALTYRAVKSAAQTVAQQLAQAENAPLKSSGPAYALLVTSDADLATADSAYLDLTTGLDEIIGAINTLLAPAKPALAVQRRELAAGVAAAVAAAIPSVLALLTTQRTLSTAATDPNDLAAVAAVAGALTGSHLTVFHDSFRLVPDGFVYKRLRELDDARNKLSVELLHQNDEVVKKTAAADDSASARDKAAARLDAATKAKQPTAELEQELATLTQAADKAASELAATTYRKAQMDTMAATTDKFLVTIRAADKGRSLLTNAALHESLHQVSGPVGSADPEGAGSSSSQSGAAPNRPIQTTHVLLVKSQAGQTDQLIGDRPLWFKDKFSAVAYAAITYILLDVTNSSIVAADTVTASAEAHGTIGESFVLGKP